MPLQIKLPSKDKIIINGAVIENAGDATTLVIHNRVDILRRKEVMKEQDATTPSRRVYYALQCAYLFEVDRGEYLRLFDELLRSYVEAAPSASGIAAEIAALIAGEKFYEALKLSHSLLEHEAERLGNVSEEG